MAVSLPCSVQDFKMIWQLKRMLWMNNHFARLWLIDITWRQRFRSTLARVMACYLVAPSQYLNQCWLIFSGMLWHSPQSDFMVSAQTTILYNEFEMIFFKFLPHFPEANELRRVSEAYSTLQLTQTTLKAHSRHSSKQSHSPLGCSISLIIIQIKNTYLKLKLWPGHLKRNITWTGRRNECIVIGSCKRDIAVVSLWHKITIFISQCFIVKWLSPRYTYMHL